MPVEDLSPSSAEPKLPQGTSLPAASTVTTEPANAESADATQQPFPEPGDSLWSSEQLGAKPYTEYLIDIKYSELSGKRQLPVANDEGDDDISCIVAIHAPVRRKTVSWTCERIGDKPVLPHWEPGNENEVYMGRDVQPASSVLTPDGRQVWRVEGVYWYALKKAIPGDRLFTGIVPFDKSPSSTQFIDGQLFDRRILKE